MTRGNYQRKWNADTKTTVKSSQNYWMQTSITNKQPIERCTKIQNWNSFQTFDRTWHQHISYHSISTSSSSLWYYSKRNLLASSKSPWIFSGANLHRYWKYFWSSTIYHPLLSRKIGPNVLGFLQCWHCVTYHTDKILLTSYSFPII